MFTSRAEYRLLLREDNADRRLSELGHRVGLLDDDDYRRFVAKRDRIEAIIGQLRATTVGPNDANRDAVADAGLGSLDKSVQADALLRRPDAQLADLDALLPGAGLAETPRDVAEAVEIEIRYAGYIERQRSQAVALQKSDRVRIPPGIDFGHVPGLSHEVREKLESVRPASLGQASRIAGVTPAAITNLWMWLRKHGADATT